MPKTSKRIVRRSRPAPCALTIAGSDSGGGAGIQADLKTFGALGVHGTSAITCLTAQNPEGVRGILACTPGMVRKQIEAVLEELPPGAVKTGMLYSAAIIQVVAECLAGAGEIPLVVDPVMVATSGARLLQPKAIRLLENRLLPLAALITPNLEEAQILAECTIEEPEDLRLAAAVLHDRYGGAVLVKGGHLKGLREAVDVFFDGETELLLSAPFVKGVSTHGTGCTYSAAIAAGLAKGLGMIEAVTAAKEYVTEAIARSIRVGQHDVLGTPAP
jgi:hydroxymethylpyrimidine/phosphomethylpyrimidine kinase